jgi:hypothetical protein
VSREAVERNSLQAAESPAQEEGEHPTRWSTGQLRGQPMGYHDAVGRRGEVVADPHSHPHDHVLLEEPRPTSVAVE